MGQHRNLEFHAARNFVERFNAANGATMEFVGLRDPPLPDALCRLDGREIGIEVAHTYGTGEEAAVRLGNIEEADVPDAVRLARLTTPLRVVALNSLNRVLERKARKKYSMSPTWLVVRNGFALWSMAEYEEHRSDIWVPHEHPFERIWILFDKNSVGEWGLMDLLRAPPGAP